MYDGQRAELIEVDREVIAHYRPRRYYRLTPAGGMWLPAALVAEVDHSEMGPDLRIGDVALAATTRSEISRAIMDLPRPDVAAAGTMFRTTFLDHG